MLYSNTFDSGKIHVYDLDLLYERRVIAAHHSPIQKLVTNFEGNLAASISTKGQMISVGLTAETDLRTPEQFRELVVSSTSREGVALRSWVDDVFAKWFLNLPGVAAAEGGGGGTREIQGIRGQIP